MIRYTTFNLITSGVMALTIAVLVWRFVGKLESNWPLVYYLLLVVYLRVFEGSIDPYVVYVAVISALFLRFEFMGGWFLKFVRVVEFGTHVYISYRCVQLILGR